MGWWIYFSGIIATLLLWAFIAYRYWNEGNDITVDNILAVLVSLVTSWAAFIIIFIICITSLLDEHSKDVIIKGKT